MTILDHYDKEKERFRKNCIQCGLCAGFPKVATKSAKSAFRRLPKPERSGWSTVCHYCNQTFAADEAHYDFGVTNYINLVAEAMNIRREDKFKKYAHWGDLERILKDVEINIAGLPFERDRIIEVLQATFLG